MPAARGSSVETNEQSAGVSNDGKVKMVHEPNEGDGRIPIDMSKENVVEPLKLIQRALESATATASLLLRIDNIIIAKEPDEFGE